MLVKLFHNAVAGNESQPDADRLQLLIRAAGHEVVYYPYPHPYPASPEADWPAILNRPCDLVVIAGGDGTAGRIAKQLVGCNVPMTFIPLGTANNISRSFGLAGLSLEQLIAGWSRARVQKLDIGVITSPWGSRYFIEGVGMGLFARTMIGIDSADALAHLESSEEKIMHALRLMSRRLEELPAGRLNLTLDGRDLSGEYIMLEVMNICFVGPNLFIAPGSDPADGLLDIVLVSEGQRRDLQKYLTSWRQGTLCAPELTTYKGKHLQIEWYGGSLHVDDEAWPPMDASLPSGPALIDVSVRMHALEIWLPDGSA